MRCRLAAFALGCVTVGACSEAPPPAVQTAKASESAGVDAAVAAFYRPYQQAFGDGGPEADWDRPIFSARVRELIARWKTGFSDEEVAELQDFAWLCECQDWDSKAFEIAIPPHREPAGGRIAVDVDIGIGWDETRRQRLDLVREGDAWLIDDIHSQSFEGGLRAALARAIERNAAGAP